MRFTISLLVFLSMATLCVARNVISRGILLGKDTSDKYAVGTSIYLQPRNRAMAVASILTEKGFKTGYIPSVSKKSKSEARFTTFEHNVVNFPGFRMTDDIAYQLYLHNGGIDDLCKVVRGAIGLPDGRAIAETMRDMIPSALSQMVEELLFSIIVIDKPEGSNRVIVKLVELSLTLVQLDDDEDQYTYEKVDDDRDKVEQWLGDRRSVSHHRKGGRIKVILPEQMTTMRIQELEVLAKYLSVNAHELARTVRRTTVQEFKDLFASKDILVDLGGHFDF